MSIAAICGVDQGRTHLSADKVGFRADKAQNGSWAVSLKISSNITPKRLLVAAGTLTFAGTLGSFVGYKLAITALAVAAKIMTFVGIALVSSVFAASFGTVVAASTLATAGFLVSYCVMSFAGVAGLSYLVATFAGGATGVYAGAEATRRGITATPIPPIPKMGIVKMTLLTTTLVSILPAAVFGYLTWNHGLQGAQDLVVHKWKELGDIVSCLSTCGSAPPKLA